MNLGKFDDAAREFESASGSAYAPGTVPAQFVRLKARQLQLSGGSAEAWRKLDEVIAAAAPKFGPASAEPVVLTADVLAARGRYADAAQLLRKETARRPGDARLWAMLAERTSEAFGTPAGLAVIDEAQAAAGDGPELRLVRAALYAREPGRFRPVHHLGERIESWSEADQLRLLTGLVEVYDQLGDGPGAVRTLRKIAARRPTEATVWLRLHERATAAKDTATASEARAAIAKIEGDAGPSLAVCDGNAERLKNEFGPSPTRADACLVLAAACTDAAETSRLIERAAALEPTRLEPVRAWLAHLCRHDPGRAAALVARLANDPRWQGDAFRRVIDGAIHLYPAAAPQLVKWCRPLVEREPGGLGWLASHGTTETLYAAATATPVTTADDWFRLSQFQLKTGKTDEGTATLAAARGKVRTSAYFAMAAAFQEMPEGRGWAPATADAPEKRALAQARLAVKLSRDDNAAAAKMLEDYIADKSIRDFDLGWGQRNLAMLYAVNGTPEDRQRAMTLIAAAGNIAKTQEELRATASVLTTLSRYLEGDDRRTVMNYAAAALEEVHKASQSPRDLFNLSQLYRAAGNTAKCFESLNTLLRADGNNIYYLTAALEEICKMADWPRAGTFRGPATVNVPRRVPGRLRGGAVRVQGGPPRTCARPRRAVHPRSRPVGGRLPGAVGPRRRVAGRVGALPERGQVPRGEGDDRRGRGAVRGARAQPPRGGRRHRRHPRGAGTARRTPSPGWICTPSTCRREFARWRAWRRSAAGPPPNGSSPRFGRGSTRSPRPSASRCRSS